MGWTDQWCSLALDAQGNPHGAYRSSLEQDLHYARRVDTADVAGPIEPRSGTHVLRLRALPNPGAAAAAIRVQLDLTCAAAVRLRILDVTGRPVAEPIARRFEPGAHELALPANLPAGVYTVAAETDDGARTALRVVRTR